MKTPKQETQKNSEKTEPFKGGFRISSYEIGWDWMARLGYLNLTTFKMILYFKGFISTLQAILLSNSFLTPPKPMARCYQRATPSSTPRSCSPLPCPHFYLPGIKIEILENWSIKGMCRALHIYIYKKGINRNTAERNI